MPLTFEWRGRLWLNTENNPWWRVAGAADFDSNGKPALAWQNDATF